MTRRALIGAQIFDGRDMYVDQACLFDGDVFKGIVACDDIPDDFATEELEGGTILPGFVDLQVNGGGGVMFNDDTSLDGLITIAEAHARTGTRAVLPTLITDIPERTRAAVDAVEAAIAAGVPGVVGVHLEGPHLSVARKGAHDPSLIRPMDDPDEAFLIEAAERLPNVMVTIAPENVSLEQMRRLNAAGIILSLGHTDCSFDTALAAFDAGVRCVTHLFNAMSQLGNREPGLVGAALHEAGVSAGIIADGFHVHNASLRTALSSKRSPGSIFLVTDAMSTVGSDISEFSLNGRKVFLKSGRLTLEDGTLAGAHLSFTKAVSHLVNEVGVSEITALAMATSGPAHLLREPLHHGHFQANNPASPILLDRNREYLRSA